MGVTIAARGTGRWKVERGMAGGNEGGRETERLGYRAVGWLSTGWRRQKRGEGAETGREEYITVSACEHKPLLIYYHFNTNCCCSDECLHVPPYVCH